MGTGLRDFPSVRCSLQPLHMGALGHPWSAGRPPSGGLAWCPQCHPDMESTVSALAQGHSSADVRAPPHSASPAPLAQTLSLPGPFPPGLRSAPALGAGTQGQAAAASRCPGRESTVVEGLVSSPPRPQSSGLPVTELLLSWWLFSLEELWNILSVLYVLTHFPSVRVWKELQRGGCLCPVIP